MMRLLTALFALFTAFSWLPQRPAFAAATLELYGTFQAMGVTATLAAADDPDQDAVANVMYRISGTDVYRQGFPLSRISATRFVGSLFWLEPGTEYDVRVAFSDPDGDPLDGTVSQATASTRAEITIPPPLHSHYVSSAGSGTACTLSEPCALAEAASRAQAGDEIVLRGGVYYEGDIMLPPGASGAPLVVRSYPGEVAILDGADPQDFVWNPLGNGVWNTTMNSVDPLLVVADGKRLYPYKTLADLAALTWGLPGYYSQGTSLYVHLDGGADPNAASMAVPLHGIAFGQAWWRQEQYYDYFLNLRFRHYDWWALPLVSGGNLVQSCTFANNNKGIYLTRRSHRNVIQDNEFYDSLTTWPFDAVKAVGYLESNSLSLDVGGRGNVIRHNVFHDMFDGFPACPMTDQVQETTNETDAYDNLVYNAVDNAVEIDGICSNVRLWNNTFHDTHAAISVAPARVGPVYVLRNVVFRGGYTGIKTMYDPPGSGPIYLFHNTIYSTSGSAAVSMSEPSTWPLLTARNNVWVGDNGKAFKSYVDDPVDLDYDEYWRTTEGALVHSNGVEYWTLAEFTAATGQERHGLNVPPGFVNPTIGDYSLSADSQLVDAGVHIPGVNDGYTGAAPDIGALERESYGFAWTVLPSTRAIAPGATTRYLIEIRPTGGFTSAVNLAAANPSPFLSVNLSPSTLVPPGHATLTITDTHPGPTLTPGVWYPIEITASGGGVSKVAVIGLLVGGARVQLPLVTRN